MMNTTATDNVVSINDTRVFDVISTFLRRKNFNSVNSGSAYETDIRQFFAVTRKKELEHINESDLTYKLADIENYQMYLFEQMQYVTSTVRRKIHVLKSLYEYLKANDFQVNPSWFKVEDLNEDDTKSWGVVQWDEIRMMIALAQDMRNGLMKGLLIELACVTSFRLTALITIEWDRDFQRIDNTWVVYGLDKGKKRIRKSITDDLYSRLQQMRSTLKPDEKRVFPISRDTANDMMHKLIEKMHIPENRNITFHSFKKTGIHEVYIATNGDILSIKKQGNHESEQTSFAYYLKFSDDPSKDPSLLVGQTVDISVVKQMSSEEIFDLLMKCSRGVQMEITNLLKGGE